MNEGNAHWYQYFGMHFIWWFVWMILLFWIFATPHEIPFQRKKKVSPLDILQRRFASGQITKVEYQNHKAILDKHSVK